MWITFSKGNLVNRNTKKKFKGRKEQMNLNITRKEALELLKKHNKEEFHIFHGLTVEGVMRYFARELGYGEDEEFWGICGLLHDIDFEEYPEEHCKKAPELLAEAWETGYIQYTGLEDGLLHVTYLCGYDEDEYRADTWFQNGAPVRAELSCDGYVAVQIDVTDFNLRKAETNNESTQTNMG